ncbi:uncharacterized protein [Macrobrachium rosenbergii]|uniref:uncharacterized protein n=1 Tax=Macrobrachium rosenbergii TaxID=79674 RepID=UPI0034D59530
MAESGQHQVQRQGVSNPANFEKETPALDNSQELIKISTTPISPSGISDSHQCFSKQVGRILSTQESSGDMVHYVLPVPYQCSGSNGSLSNLKEATSKQSNPYQTGLGQRSSGALCSVDRLEQVAEDLSVPSSKPVNEGPAQAQDIQRPGGSGSSQLAEEQLVPASSRGEASVLTDSQSKTDANSTNSDCVSFLKSTECPSFMDFMKFAAQKDANIDPVNTLFLESDKRESTLRQYDSAVKKLALFLKESEATIMTTNLAISFFRPEEFYHNPNSALVPVAKESSEYLQAGMVVEHLLGKQATDLKAAWPSLGLSGPPSLQGLLPQLVSAPVVTHTAPTMTTSMVMMTACAKMPVTVYALSNSSEFCPAIPAGFAVSPLSHAVPSMMVTSSVPHMMVPAPAAPAISAVWTAVAAPPALAVPATPIATPAVTDAPAAPVALAALAASATSAAPSWLRDLIAILKKMTKKKSRKRSCKVSLLSSSLTLSSSSSSAASSPSSSKTHCPEKRKAASPPQEVLPWGF